MKGGDREGDHKGRPYNITAVGSTLVVALLWSPGYRRTG
jgi:hypothetical protein